MTLSKEYRQSIVNNLSEDEALELVSYLRQEHGWSLCLFTRDDLEYEMREGESLGDHHWDRIRGDGRWMNLFDDGIMEGLRVNIDGLLTEVMSDH